MKYFFASDIHLGLDIEGNAPRERERRFTEWLEMVEQELKAESGALFLLGDIFDFWFEYREVVPKGFIRVLGTLARMCDHGTEVHFFIGNHDTWCYDYLEKEIGVHIHKKNEILHLAGKTCMIGHGHGLRLKPVNLRYQIMYTIFNSPFAYKIYSRLVHPDISMIFGKSWSRANRRSKMINHRFTGEKEPAVRFAREFLATGRHIDYFIFGHFHTPVVYPLNDSSELIILGEWIQTGNRKYAVLNETGCTLHSF